MKPEYMLDTDTVSYWFRDEGRVRVNVGRREPAALCISAVTLAELRFGATQKHAAKLHRLIDDFVGQVAVMPFNRHTADHYAIVASELATSGTPIGDFDTIIAAHAIALNLTLVTNNLKHFSRVPGLRIENWA